VKDWIFLRVAAVIALVYFAGHTAGAPWIPDKGADSLAVVAVMKGREIAVQGAHGTYWGFYYGFGVIISVFLALAAVLLWQLASIARRGSADVRPMVAAILVAYVANAIVAWEYFFVGPVVLAGAIAACLAVALLAAPRPGSQDALAR
jgi:hypothetical protein